MCNTCGCGQPGERHNHKHRVSATRARKQPLAIPANRTLNLQQAVLSKNDQLAAGNRQVFARHGILALNLISSPGSGKTTLLEHTLTALRGEIPCAVIEGDQQTRRDADRIAATGVPVVQINTNTACHLDAHQVAHALDELDLTRIRLLFIENVGNLVCPASFDLGETAKIVLLSVTEGEDKPVKYPLIFHLSEQLLFTKIDLLPYVPFNLDSSKQFALQVNPRIGFIETSATTGRGMDAWLAWLRNRLSRIRGGE